MRRYINKHALIFDLAWLKSFQADRKFTFCCFVSDCDGDDGALLEHPLLFVVTRWVRLHFAGTNFRALKLKFGRRSAKKYPGISNLGNKTYLNVNQDGAQCATLFTCLARVVDNRLMELGFTMSVNLEASTGTFATQ